MPKSPDRRILMPHPALSPAMVALGGLTNRGAIVNVQWGKLGIAVRFVVEWFSMNPRIEIENGTAEQRWYFSHPSDGGDNALPMEAYCILNMKEYRAKGDGDRSPTKISAYIDGGPRILRQRWKCVTSSTDERNAIMAWDYEIFHTTGGHPISSPDPDNKPDPPWTFFYGTGKRPMEPPPVGSWGVDETVNWNDYYINFGIFNGRIDLADITVGGVVFQTLAFPVVGFTPDKLPIFQTSKNPVSGKQKTADEIAHDRVKTHAAPLTEASGGSTTSRNWTAESDFIKSNHRDSYTVDKNASERDTVDGVKKVLWDGASMDGYLDEARTWGIYPLPPDIWEADKYDPSTAAVRSAWPDTKPDPPA